MSAQRDRGTAFETALRKLFSGLAWEPEWKTTIAAKLAAIGRSTTDVSALWPQCRRTGTQAADLGDLAETGPAMVIEAKDWKTLSLPQWIKQAEEAAVKTKRFPVVIAKRRGKNVAESYVILPLWSFMGIVVTSRREQL